MDILMVNTLYDPYQVGGAERSTQLLAEGLVEAGHDVAVACTAPPGKTDQQMVNGVRVHYLGLKNVYWQFREEEKRGYLKPLWHALDSYNPFMQSDVAAVLDEETPDVVHTHNLGGFSVSAWAAAEQVSIPVVHTLRDYALLCPRNMFRDGENCTSQCLRCRPFAFPRRRLTKRVSAVVGISQFILDRYRTYGYFSGSKLQTVIYNPFPLPENHPETEWKKDTFKDGDSPLQVGFLGRLSPMKGIEHLLRAVDELRSEGRNIELRIGGAGEERYVEKLQKRYASDGVDFYGFVDPGCFLPTLDVLAVPSCWHEPFGRVVIEAFAYGVPVVAAQRGGLPEIVEEGRTGWTYDPDIEGTLRNQLRKIEESQRPTKEMKRAASKEANVFSITTHVSLYERVYDKLIENNKKYV